jgi:hypothetical protein
MKTNILVGYCINKQHHLWFNERAIQTTVNNTEFYELNESINTLWPMSSSPFPFRVATQPTQMPASSLDSRFPPNSQDLLAQLPSDQPKKLQGDGYLLQVLLTSVSGWWLPEAFQAVWLHARTARAGPVPALEVTAHDVAWLE